MSSKRATRSVELCQINEQTLWTPIRLPPSLEEHTSWVVHRPLIRLEPLSASMPSGIQGLVISSRITLNYHGHWLKLFRGPVWVVGETTSMVCRQLNLNVTRCADSAAGLLRSSLPPGFLYVGAQHPCEVVQAAVTQGRMMHLPAYRTVSIDHEAHLVNSFSRIVFASPSAVHCFCQLSEGRPPIIVIGNTTKMAAIERGFSSIQMPLRPSLERCASLVLNG